MLWVIWFRKQKTTFSQICSQTSCHWDIHNLFFSYFTHFDSILMSFVSFNKVRTSVKKQKKISMLCKVQMQCASFPFCGADFAMMIIKLHTTKTTTGYATHIMPYISKLLHFHPLKIFPKVLSLLRTELLTLWAHQMKKCPPITQHNIHFPDCIWNLAK